MCNINFIKLHIIPCKTKIEPIEVDTEISRLEVKRKTQNTHTNDVDKQPIGYIDNCILFINNEKQHLLTMIICL